MRRYFSFCLITVLSLLTTPFIGCQKEQTDDGACTQGAARFCTCSDGYTGAEFCIENSTWTRCLCNSPRVEREREQHTNLLKQDLEEHWHQLLTSPNDPNTICNYARQLQYLNQTCLALDAYNLLPEIPNENIPCFAKATEFRRLYANTCNPNISHESKREKQQESVMLARSSKTAIKLKFDEIWTQLYSNTKNHDKWCPFIEILYILHESPCFIYDVYSVANQYNINLECGLSTDNYISQYAYCIDSDSTHRRFYRHRLISKLDTSANLDIPPFDELDNDETDSKTQMLDQNTRRLENSFGDNLQNQPSTETIKQPNKQPTRLPTPTVETQITQPEEIASPQPKLSVQMATEKISEARRAKDGTTCKQIAHQFPKNTNIQCHAFECLKKDPTQDNCAVFKFAQNLRKQGGGFCLEQVQAFLKANSICWNK